MTGIEPRGVSEPYELQQTMRSAAICSELHELRESEDIQVQVVHVACGMGGAERMGGGKGWGDGNDTPVAAAGSSLQAHMCGSGAAGRTWKVTGEPLMGTPESETCTR